MTAKTFIMKKKYLKTSNLWQTFNTGAKKVSVHG